MDVFLVKNANRMMTTAALLDDGIEMSFADGITGFIPYAEVPQVKSREGVSELELPNPYEMDPQSSGARQRRRLIIFWNCLKSTRRVWQRFVATSGS